MIRTDEARESLLAAATAFLSSRLFMDCNFPGPNDDAELEMREDLLKFATYQYTDALRAERATK